MDSATRSSPSTSQHPSDAQTPFAAYASDLELYTSTSNDGTDRYLYGGPQTNSIIIPPADLLPQGLLQTPQPSTRMPSLTRPGIVLPTSSGGNDSSGPQRLVPLDSLILPSPSLLPGGVHSLPTPTNSSSGIQKGVDSLVGSSGGGGKGTPQSQPYRDSPSTGNEHAKPPLAGGRQPSGGSGPGAPGRPPMPSAPQGAGGRGYGQGAGQSRPQDAQSQHHQRHQHREQHRNQPPYSQHQPSSGSGASTAAAGHGGAYGHGKGPEAGHGGTAGAHGRQAQGASSTDGVGGGVGGGNTSHARSTAHGTHQHGAEAHAGGVAHYGGMGQPPPPYGRQGPAAPAGQAAAAGGMQPPVPPGSPAVDLYAAGHYYAAMAGGGGGMVGDGSGSSAAHAGVHVRGMEGQGRAGGMGTAPAWPNHQQHTSQHHAHQQQQHQHHQALGRGPGGNAPPYGHGHNAQAARDSPRAPYGMGPMHGGAPVYGMGGPQGVLPNTGSPHLDAMAQLLHGHGAGGAVLMPPHPSQPPRPMGHMGHMGAVGMGQARPEDLWLQFGHHPLAAHGHPGAVPPPPMPHMGGPGVGPFPHHHHHHQGSLGMGMGVGVGPAFGGHPHGFGAAPNIAHMGQFGGVRPGGKLVPGQMGFGGAGPARHQPYGGVAGAKGVGVGEGAGGGRDSPRLARQRKEKAGKTDKGGSGQERPEKSRGNVRAPALVAHCAAPLAALDAQLHQLVGRLTPSQEELAAYDTALQEVSELVACRWPDAKVHLFGSAATGLSLAGVNEMDVTVEVPGMAWDDYPGRQVVVAELGELAGGPPASQLFLNLQALRERHQQQQGRKEGKEEGAEEGGKPEQEGEQGKEEAEEVKGVARGGAQGSEHAVGGGATLGAETEAEGTKEVQQGPGKEDSTVEGQAATAAASEGGVEAAPEAPAAAAAGDAAGSGAGAAGTAPRRLMEAVLALPKARTPVVKLTVPDTKTRVDITVHNLLSLHTTRLLASYCELDPRLRQLVLLVKHWARARGVNDVYRGSLSSYAYVLLCVWLLQQRQPPVLPVLQARQPHTYDVTVGPWRCSYNDQLDDVRGFGEANKETLAELLVAFFDHWAWRHDYNNAVVCVRTGGTVTKAAKDWTKRQGNERHLMCIEDPFELSHDLGRTIDKAAVQVLRRELERAARVLASNPDPLPELLAALTPEEESVVAAALQSRKKNSNKAAATAAAAGDNNTEGAGAGEGQGEGEAGDAAAEGSGAEKEDGKEAGEEADGGSDEDGEEDEDEAESGECSPNAGGQGGDSGEAVATDGAQEQPGP